MVILLPKLVEDRLRELAGARGRSVDALIEEAVRQFLEASGITDVTADDIAQTQLRLAKEFKDTPADHYPEEAA